MELRVIGRGALAGLFAGVLGFVFARIFAEPVIDKAIAYESARDDVLNALRQAAGLPTEEGGPEIFSRTVQSTLGVASGIIALSVAFGALVAVVYLLLARRIDVQPRVLAWSVAAFGFLGFFLLPFVKYPSNPPSIGHEFTIGARGQLQLGLVIASFVLLAAAVLAWRALHPRIGAQWATLIVVAGFLVVYGTLIGLLPSLGNLPANVQVSDELGFARAATETPQPIVNTLGKVLTVDGNTYAPGQIVFPGFDADLLWSFRWYSLLNQVLIWGVIGVTFGALMERVAARSTAPVAAAAAGHGAAATQA